MKGYHVACPGCMRMIEIEMDKDDKRRNEDKFFIVVCGHCSHQWYAKIFESLSVYPFMLIEQKGG